MTMMLIMMIILLIIEMVKKMITMAGGEGAVMLMRTWVI
jgi:hypothetical protein